MIQILNKHGATNSDDANVIVLDKNGNVKKIGETSGTVTSIITASPITGGTITSSGTIGITQSNTSTDGYLSSTDWNTFNNKQNVLINPITGTGANGQVAFFNGATTQTGDNGLFWDNTNKRGGFGTNNPQARLDVRAQGALSTDIVFRVRNSDDTANLISVDGIGQTLLTPTTLTGTSKTSALDIAQTWNTTGTPSLIKANVTNTASNFASLLMDLQTGGTTRFSVGKDGGIYFGTFLSQVGQIYATNPVTGSSLANGRALGLCGNTRNQVGYDFWIVGGSRTTTSGNNGLFTLINDFSPTSGTGLYNTFNVIPTINQTGGANGITRGLFVNPTLTSAADFRAIESSSGGAYINTTSVQASAILQADSTTKGFLLPRMTTAQRDAIVSPAIGLQIFNTTAGYLEYFDSFWGWMPIDNSNDWKRRNGTEYFNDFGQNNTFSDGVFQTFPINGGGALSFNPTPNTSDYIGFQGLTTGVNSNGQNALRTDLNIGRFFNFNCGRKSFISRIWVQALSSVTDRFVILNGFSTSANTSMAAGATFLYDEGGIGTGTTASPNWQIITANGSVRTNFVTSVVVSATTWYSFKIESNANDTEIYYYINNVLVRTETTNIPTGIQSQPIISITKSIGTTNRAIAVDYLGLKIKLNNQR